MKKAQRLLAVIGALSLGLLPVFAVPSSALAAEPGAPGSSLTSNGFTLAVNSDQYLLYNPLLEGIALFPTRDDRSPWVPNPQVALPNLANHSIPDFTCQDPNNPASCSVQFTAQFDNTKVGELNDVPYQRFYTLFVQLENGFTFANSKLVWSKDPRLLNWDISDFYEASTSNELFRDGEWRIGRQQGFNCTVPSGAPIVAGSSTGSVQTPVGLLPNYPQENLNCLFNQVALYKDSPIKSVQAVWYDSDQYSSGNGGRLTYDALDFNIQPGTPAMNLPSGFPSIGITVPLNVNVTASVNGSSRMSKQVFTWFNTNGISYSTFEQNSWRYKAIDAQAHISEGAPNPEPGDTTPYPEVPNPSLPELPPPGPNPPNLNDGTPIEEPRSNLEECAVLDVNCYWEVLFIPKTDIVGSVNSLIVTGGATFPFGIMQNVVKNVNEINKLIEETKTCELVTIDLGKFPLKEWGDDFRIKFQPCYEDVAAFTQPISLFLSFISAIVISGVWVWRKFDLSFSI